jgi:hypothetical protein
MRSLLVRSSALGALLLMPAFTALAQDPRQQRPAQYSAEELDNLVAPVALYADALLAQVLVAATFPDQIALASKHVKARGTKSVDDQDWDVSVRAIAHYPPVLNMLARQEDWTIALGQAYASQPGEVLDAVQRLRQMAREQGNLESTREQNVSVQRDYIVIEPANPEVIYVPTYEPYYVYAAPLYGYGSHFGFGIGFPWGPWLSYGCDWFAGRVFWHGGGCCGGFVSPWINTFGTLDPRAGPQPKNRYVPTNPGVYSRRANYANLDRDFRSVRSDVSFARHSKPGVGTATGTAGPGDGRVASFSGIRRDAGASTTGTRYADPVSPDGFGKTKPGSGATGNGPTVIRGSQASGTAFSSTVRTADSKPRSSGPVVYRGGTGSSTPTFTSTTRASAGKTSGSGPVVYRGSRPQSPQFVGAATRSTGGKAGNGGPIVYRGSGRAPTFTSQARPTAGKGGVRSGGQVFTQPMRAPTGGSSRSSFSGTRSGYNGFGSTTIRSSGGMGAATVRPSGGGTISGGAVRITGFGGRRQD